MNTNIVSTKDINLFVKFAIDYLNLPSSPKINLVGSSNKLDYTFGNFSSNKTSTVITVRIVGRHPVDVMRTIAHELIHYKQKIDNSSQNEDDANKSAGKIVKAFDLKHPHVFADQPIKEEDAGGAGVGTTSSLPVNHTGGGIDNFDPLLSKKKKIIKRKPYVKEHVIARLIGTKGADQNLVKPPKKLKDILKRDTDNEKRAETRVS